ncbi:MAG: AI-2E family transporter, partial [Methanobrevibacter sp.]|nr:AI-2E family transporter [Candidatus Methanovirga australis]
MEKTVKKLMGSSYSVLIILLAFSFLVLTPVVNMIILGAIISYGIKPLSIKIRSKLRFNSISIILVIVLVIIPLLLIFIYSLSVLLHFTYSFLSTSSLSSHSMANETVTLLNQYLPSDFHGFSKHIISSIGGYVHEILTRIFSYLISFIQSVPMISLHLFVLLASIYYFTKDGTKLKPYVYAFIPDDRKDYFSKIF